MQPSKIKVGIIQFPASNCEQDCLYVLKHIFGTNAQLLWHADPIADIGSFQCLLLPGGFSYGDYLRAGAMARLSPAVDQILTFAERGGLVVGICNGFQILTELRLLPGALMTNRSLNFICQDVWLRLENPHTPFSCAGKMGEVSRMPISHHQGCFYIDAAGHKALQSNQQILWRYCNARGELDAASNPNGSMDHIAAITNKRGNVMGMMPHPDRAAEGLLGSEDGRVLFASLLKNLN